MPPTKIANQEQVVLMLAPFNPSADQTIEIAIDLLQLNQNDILYDLGCGDGRLLFAASSKVHRCVGVEVDETFVLRARKVYCILLYG